MEQIKYQGYARDRGFNPIQMSTASVDAIGQQGNAMLRQMRDNQDIERSNRNAFQSQVQQNQQIESQNRSENYQFDKRSRDMYQQGVLQNLKTQQQNELVKADDLEKTLKGLSAFSTTIGKTLTDLQEKRKQSDIEAGILLYRQNGLPPEKALAFEQNEQAFIQARDVTNSTAAQLAKNGNPPEFVERVQALSGWKRYGYMQALAMGSSREWASYLDNKLLTDNETQINIGNSVVTPAQAAKADDPVVLGVTSKVLLQQFLRERGLTSVNPALLNKYFFTERFDTEEAAVLKRWNGENNDRKAAERLDEEAGILANALRDPQLAGQAFNTYISNVSPIRHPKLGLLGLGGGRDQAIQILKQLGKAGDIPAGVREAILNQEIPGGGQTWGQKFPQVFAGLDDEIEEGIQSDLRRQEAQEAFEDKEQEERIVSYLTSKGGATESDIAQITQDYNARGKSLPDNIKNLLTVEKKEDQAARDYLDAQLASGRGISLNELRTGGYSDKVILDYEKKVRTFQENITNNSSYKAEVQALGLLIETNIRGASLDKRAHWTEPLAKAEAESLLRQEYLNLVTGGTMGQADALANASKKVRILIDQGKPRSGNPMGTGPFALEIDSANPEAPKPGGGFRKYMTGPSGKVIEARQAFLRLEEATRTDANAFKNQVLISSSDFKQLEVLRANPSAAFPASIIYMAKKAGLGPWDIADGQLQAAKKPLLTRPPEVQWADQIDPNLRMLLYRDPSRNRTNRAFAGTQWNSAKVPNNWGIHVEQAAAKYGLDPALLAGLLAHESAGWKANAVSTAGAVGLGQIMDNTLAEAGMTAKDRLDPVKSIYGAAKIFSGRLGAVKGDLTLALRAYNMGLNGAMRNPGGYRGDDESINYPARVLKQAAVYGYGFGQGSPYRQAATMNPRIVYSIGSLGYGSTGPHLDLKRVDRGTMTSTGSVPIKPQELDNFVEVKVGNRWLPLSKGTTLTDQESEHRARGSYGIDYAANAGTPVRVRNGAVPVGSFKGDGGTDHLIIELPDGRRFQFLHGTNA